MSNGLPIPILIHEKSQIFLSIKITSFTSKWYYWWWLSIESINLLFLPIKWILETYTVSWNFFLGEHLCFSPEKILKVSYWMFLRSSWLLQQHLYSHARRKGPHLYFHQFLMQGRVPLSSACVWPQLQYLFVSPEERVSFRTQFFHRRLLLPALCRQDWCDSRDHVLCGRCSVSTGLCHLVKSLQIQESGRVLI